MLKTVKAVIATIAVVGVAALGGCTSSQSSAADFVGEWTLTAVEAEEAEYEMSEDDVAAMAEMGMTVTLEVTEDGKVSMSTMGQSIDGTWEAEGDSATFTIEGESVPVTVSGDELSLNSEEGRMIFHRGTSEVVQSSEVIDESEVVDVEE